jgi:hypothetical protein
MLPCVQKVLSVYSSQRMCAYGDLFTIPDDGAEEEMCVEPNARVEDSQMSAHAVFGAGFTLATTIATECMGHAVGIRPLHKSVVTRIANNQLPVIHPNRHAEAPISVALRDYAPVDET